MWTTSGMALMAVLLSNSALALPQVPVTTVVKTATVYVEWPGFTEEYKIQAEKTSTTVIMSTVSVIPQPLSVTSSTSQLPSGIFYPGQASGSIFASGSGISCVGTGSGSCRPTGKPGRNSTRTRTHTRTVDFGSQSSSFSFFPLSTSSSASDISTTSNELPNFTTVISIPAPTSSLESSSTSLEPSSSMSSASSTSTTTEASSQIAIASTPSSTGIPFLRGVNLGGWLVLEKWMNDEAFSGAFSSAVDQYTFDTLPNSAAALKTHWSTFFTESDIKTIAATGINALRIPIGYWAYDNADSPYHTGADAYLEKAIGWARNAGMKVWVDLHGSPGSQNGFDNSGQKGNVDWQQESNLARSIAVLKTMATKYGSLEYADVVVGLEMVNEPISYGNNKFATTQTWAQSAYTAVRAAAENKNMVIVMHDAFEGAPKWTNIATSLNADRSFGVDSHMYQLFSDADNTLTQAQHITKACGWADELASANAVMPTYVGEWSAATNICVNPDGSTTAGTSCSVDGCQCQSVAFDKWNEGMVEQVRRYVEAQLDVFESSSSGYFIWSAKGPGGWGFLNGIGNGAIPNPVTERKYPGQCGGGKRRSARGSLGSRGETW